MEEMIKKLEEILSNLEYGSSDLDSAKNSLPDCAEKTQLEQSESYLYNAKSDLEDLLEELRKKENV